MNENVAVHSNKHLEYLLEKTVMDSDEVEEDRLSSPAVDTNNTHSNQFDILKIGQGNTGDTEAHYDNEQKPNLRSVNPLDSEGSFAGEGSLCTLDQNSEQVGVNNNGHPDFGHEDARLEDLKKQFKKLQEDYSNFQNAVLTDSLDVDSEETENSYNAFIDASNNQSRQEIDNPSFQGYANQNGYNVSSEALLLMHDDDNTLHDSDNESGYGKHNDQKPADHNEDLQNMEAKPRPKFKYKEPSPIFVTKNKTNLGRKSQGSYSQKFKTEKQIVNGKQKKREQNRTGNFNENPGLIQQQHDVHIDNMSVGFEDLQNQMVQPWQQSNSQMNGQPLQLPMQDLRHLRESLEISRLEDMIREEEDNLKNHVLDISPKDTGRPVYGYPESYQNIENSFPPQIEQQTNVRALLPSFKRQSIGNSSQITRRDDPQKNSSYAEKHILSFDKIKETTSDSPASYAAQHLEKRNPTVSYKRYSLKDYKALTMEVKLQKSLGPDKFSEQYIEKVKILFL